VYVFHGNLGTVLVMCLNNSAASIDSPGPFRPNEHYDFRVDVNGDAVENHAFQVVFGESAASRPQPLELRMLSGADARDHHTSGDLMAWCTVDKTISGTYGLRLWLGMATQPFYVDPTVLEAVRHAVHTGAWSISELRSCVEERKLHGPRGARDAATEEPVREAVMGDQHGVAHVRAGHLDAARALRERLETCRGADWRSRTPDLGPALQWAWRG